MVFPVVMYGCESWTVKKAEHRRIDAFELWCWRRLLRVLWTARRSNQSILKEIGPGCSLEGLVLKLKLQYFGYLVRRVDSLEKTLMLGRIGGRRRRGWQRMRWLDGITDSMDMELGIGDGQGGLACCDSCSCKQLDMTERLNWTELCQWNFPCYKKFKRPRFFTCNLHTAFLILIKYFKYHVILILYEMQRKFTCPAQGKPETWPQENVSQFIFLSLPSVFLISLLYSCPTFFHRKSWPFAAVCNHNATFLTQIHFPVVPSTEPCDTQKQSIPLSFLCLSFMGAQGDS